MTIKKIIFTLLFFNVVLINPSYSQKYNAIDSIVLKYPNFGSAEKVAERIQKDFTSEHDKARAIYSWIALNLNYDIKEFLKPASSKMFSYKNNSEGDKERQRYYENRLKKTFRSKLGVCEDFSRLYAYIGTLAGLKVQVISGDAKTLLTDIGRKRLYTNHAWNIVEIDGREILIDATWGEGYMDTLTNTTVKWFTPIYFDMDPKYFFAKHFPDSGTYPDFKIDKEHYLSAPLIYNKIIEGDYEIIAPSSGIIQANEGDKMIFKFKNLSEFNEIYCTNEHREHFAIKNMKEENNILELEFIYEKKMGRFITFFRYEYALASFKIIPK